MGKVIITGSGGGVDTSIVTASANDILTGKIIVDKEGNQLVGIMPNNGAVSQSLNAGGSYTIPKGYHNGSGKVTVQSLATITSAGTVTSNSQILSGYKAYSDGTLYTGSMTNQGAKTASLNCGDSYTIPAGYHNGSGKVTANSLASQFGNYIYKRELLLTMEQTGTIYKNSRTQLCSCTLSADEYVIISGIYRTSNYSIPFELSIGTYYAGSIDYDIAGYSYYFSLGSGYLYLSTRDDTNVPGLRDLEVYKMTKIS